MARPLRIEIPGAWYHVMARVRDGYLSLTETCASLKGLFNRPSLEELFSGGFDKVARNSLFLSAIEEHDYTQSEVVCYLGTHSSTVSKLLRRQREANS